MVDGASLSAVQHQQQQQQLLQQQLTAYLAGYGVGNAAAAAAAVASALANGQELSALLGALPAEISLQLHTALQQQQQQQQQGAHALLLAQQQQQLQQQQLGMPWEGATAAGGAAAGRDGPAQADLLIVSETADAHALGSEEQHQQQQNGVVEATKAGGNVPTVAAVEGSTQQRKEQQLEAQGLDKLGQQQQSDHLAEKPDLGVGPLGLRSSDSDAAEQQEGKQLNGPAAVDVNAAASGSGGVRVDLQLKQVSGVEPRPELPQVQHPEATTREASSSSSDAQAEELLVAAAVDESTAANGSQWQQQQQQEEQPANPTKSGRATMEAVPGDGASKRSKDRVPRAGGAVAAAEAAKAALANLATKRSVSPTKLSSGQVCAHMVGLRPVESLYISFVSVGSGQHWQKSRFHKHLPLL